MKLKIKEVLRKKEITFRDFANSCGLTERTLYNYCSNITVPSLDSLSRMCSVLGCKFEDVVEY